MAGESSSDPTLESAIKENEESIIKTLNMLLSDGKREFQDLDTIKYLLDVKNSDIIKLTAQWIAELAKTAENRTRLTDPDIIKILLSHLNNENTNLCNIQLCRALANISCENSVANNHLLNLGALEQLINFIESNANSDDTELLNVACGFLSNFLTANLTGQKRAIELNILNLIEKVIAPRINNISTCENLFLHLLIILSFLSQNMSDTWFSHDLCLHLVNMLELSTNANISELCLEILNTEGENDDIKLFLAEASLCELLFNLLEKHKDLVQDAEGRALLKSACDLIVLILTGDESMTYLYNDGNGKVYNDMLTWLDSDDVDLMSTAILAIGNFARNDSHCIKMVENGLSEILLNESMTYLYNDGNGKVYNDMLTWLDSDDVDLMSTAILAIGNFARNDSHCIKMVENGLSEILLRILSKHNDVTADVRLQHALLSALRNLVIPSANKAQIIKEGLIDIIYPLITTSHQVVVFKLLGTLRMLIDGQAETAVDLAMRVDFLEKLVDWCFNSDHPGVKAESLRLLAWLIKHCHSTKPFPVILSVDKCLKCLVEMLSSPHALMQNEAILALNILCATYLTDNNINLTDNQKLNSAKQKSEGSDSQTQAEMSDSKTDLGKTLVEDDVGKFLTFLLTRHGEEMAKEIVANLVTLLEYLVQISILKEHLKQDDFIVVFKKLSEREALKPLHERIKNVLTCIDSS